MRCPFCATQDTKVIDSRLVTEGDQVRRRRECIQCLERFTTYEKAELNLPRIIKRDGSREVFNEEKLKSGLLLALQKRPVNMDVVDSIIHNIRHKLQNSSDHEVCSRTIGEWVMQQLRKADEVAYVRFASVYRRFKDLNEFKEEIDKLSD